MAALEKDEYWMQKALQAADNAGKEGEVPVGAVIVCGDEILATAGNRPVSMNDPTAHAEIEAIRAACQRVNNYRLTHSTLYVTLEPCAMCVGAMIHARISRLVYGADEPKSGAVRSQNKLLEIHPFNWRLTVEHGVLAKECSQMLSTFFSSRRKAHREKRRM